MDWEEYGLRISVPEGSLSSSETTEIAVIALVGGHFKYVLIFIFVYSFLPFSFRFPKNTRLVSAVYAISASHLIKSLKLEVQHCIDLSDPSLCKYMKFAVAPVHTSSLPYQFNIVEGGEFPANSRYGSIERSEFCLLAIVGEEMNGGQEQSNGEQQEPFNAWYNDSNDEYYRCSEDEYSGHEGCGNGGGRYLHGGRRGRREGERSGHYRRQTQEPNKEDFTGIPEATVYAGQVFYEHKELMRFTAAKDLNALRKVKVLDEHLYPCN